MLEVVKILAVDLEPGMYVANLDRPWLETPFLMQGFQVESEEDIRRLQKYCRYVYIDPVKSVQTPDVIQRKVRTRPRRSVPELFGSRRLTTYQDSSTWGEEYPRAKQAVQGLSAGIDQIFDQMEQGGALDMVRIKKSIDPMIDSVIRNPDACVWLARMKQEDHYTYQHSLGASIWAVALGRQLGLPKADLRSLAIGGLLFDVGKLGVDKQLLATDRPLTDEEFQQVRDHVRIGVEMIEGSALMNADVVDMIKCHHERHDGSGYPQGLKDDDIPVFARMAAIVDCYDAITSNRGYATAISPAKAIKMLNDWKDVDFQGELIEEFIQAVGIYPAGTLVELSSGEVAVVVAGYRTRRLRPVVMVLLDRDKQPLADTRMLDLLTEKTTADGQSLEIVGSLELAAYDVDLTAIQL